MEVGGVDSRFATYLAVAALLIVTPGPDMALVARNAFRGGYCAARATAFGVGAGILIWGCGCAAGLASLLAASAGLYSVLKMAGAVFLMILGLRSLLSAARPQLSTAVRGHLDAERRPNGAAAFAQGLAGNLLNPKAGAIFVAVVPQFIVPGDSLGRLAAMTGAFVVMVTAWLNVYGWMVARATSRFGPAVRRILDAIAGVVMTTLGGRLAFERR